MDASNKRSRPTSVTPKTIIHVGLSEELKNRLVKMAGADRRKHSDFLRLLIDDEWERRQKAAAGNGAAA
jgi:predicted transcriptional regulator